MPASKKSGVSVFPKGMANPKSVGRVSVISRPYRLFLDGCLQFSESPGNADSEAHLVIPGTVGLDIPFSFGCGSVCAIRIAEIADVECQFKPFFLEERA